MLVGSAKFTMATSNVFRPQGRRDALELSFLSTATLRFFDVTSTWAINAAELQPRRAAQRPWSQTPPLTLSSPLRPRLLSSSTRSSSSSSEQFTFFSPAGSSYPPSTRPCVISRNQRPYSRLLQPQRRAPDVHDMTVDLRFYRLFPPTSTWMESSTRKTIFATHPHLLTHHHHLQSLWAPTLQVPTPTEIRSCEGLQMRYQSRRRIWRRLRKSGLIKSSSRRSHRG